MGTFYADDFENKEKYKLKNTICYVNRPDESRIPNTKMRFDSKKV